MPQHILITGASSGIGNAAASSLARAGMTVFAGTLSNTEADMMRKEGIKNLHPIVLDVTNSVSINSALEQVASIIGIDGHLHALIHCAGINFNAPLHVLEEREIMQMINVNYIGGVMLTRAALPLLRRNGSRLVFVSSAMALLRTPMVSIYCSTKTGIEGFADALRLEMISFGVKVSIVEPGVIRTPMVNNAFAVLERLLLRMTAEDRRHYEPMMRKIAKMSGNPKTGSSTHVTTAAIQHALTAKNPRRRYRAGMDCKAAAAISILPYAVQDWIQRKLYGISPVPSAAESHLTNRVQLS